MSAGERTRRAFLGLLVLGGGAVAGRWLWDRVPFVQRPSADERFRELLPVESDEGERYREVLLDSPHTALMSAEFGRLYLERRDRDDADVTTLGAEVMARLETLRPWRQLPGTLEPTQLDQRLGEAIRADFLAEAGICEIDGWYLAQTECRLAAMKFLAAS